MYKHYILTYSDYILGRRIAYHIEEETGSKIVEKVKKIKKKLMEKYPNIKYGAYYITTEEAGWEGVEKYDSFYEGIIEVKLKEFYDAIEKNLYLKEEEEKRILKKESNESNLKELSLYSRKDNLSDEFFETLPRLDEIVRFKQEQEKKLKELKEKYEEFKIIIDILNVKEESGTPFNAYVNGELRQLEKKLKEIHSKNLHSLYEIKVQIDKLDIKIKRIIKTVAGNKQIKKILMKLKKG